MRCRSIRIWIPYRTGAIMRKPGVFASRSGSWRASRTASMKSIDFTLQDGSLTYGECVLPGQIADEFLISVHICSPVIGQRQPVRRGGSDSARQSPGIDLASLHLSLPVRARHDRSDRLASAKSGCRATGEARLGACLRGRPGSINYKRSRRLSADIDRAVEHVLRSKGAPFELRDFSPYGYDERQYCSPGFDLPVGSLRRTPHGEYPEYHTSADNLEFVSADHLGVR